MSKRIFVARVADASNYNAQAKNAQHILACWRSTEYRPCILTYGAPELAVANNPNVDVIQLRRGRIWRADLYAKYFGRYDAIFYPGLHHRSDWLALKTREILGLHLPLIATVEGVLSGADNRRARTLSALAGHSVYTQEIDEARFRRAESTLRMADHIIAISPFLERLATQLFGPKVSMLPLGVDTKLFSRTESVARKRPRVIGAGTVRQPKRAHLFIDCAAKFPQADFVWFGSGENFAEVQALAANSGLPNVAYPGGLAPDALAREFAASDIFVFPSLGEGVPKVTQEAAAAGLAQIIFGFYEAPTVVDGKNGFVVWTDDEMYSRLGQLLESPGLVEQMGRAGAKMAGEWTWDLIAPRWERRIIDVLEGRSFAG